MASIILWRGKFMADEQPVSIAHSIAQQTQEKFEFYLLSLVFTLLGLAVQSASFGTYLTKDGLQYFAYK